MKQFDPPPDGENQSLMLAYLLSDPRPQRTAPPTIGEWAQTTWPARLGQSLYRAFTLPGDVMRDPNVAADVAMGSRMSDDSFQRVTDLAGAVQAGATAFPTGPNALRSGFSVDYFGQPVRVLENPSPRELTGFLSRTKYKAARRIVDPETGRAYVWDAADPALHQMMAERIGIRFDPSKADMIGLD